MAKMHTGPVNPYCAQELAKLTSAVIPLQKLQIHDNTPMEVPKSKLEVGPAFRVSKGGMGPHHHLYRLSALLAPLLGGISGAAAGRALM